MTGDRHGSLAVVGVFVFLLLGGCKGDAAKNEQSTYDREVYHLVVRQVLAAPSAKVISAVGRAIDATRLDMVSKSTTNIDALFHVQSALRKEFKVEVEAVSHHQTRLEISTLDRSDKALAQILFERITSNL